mgnify:CR=1 FL=1
MVVQLTFSVYSITSSVPGCNIIYVGSTRNRPSKRFSSHKCLVNRLRSPLYTHFAACGKDKMIFNILEQDPFITSIAMRQREQFWLTHYRTTNAQILNTNNATNQETPAQRYQREREALREARDNPAARARAHAYYIANRLTIRERSRARYNARNMI